MTRISKIFVKQPSLPAAARFRAANPLFLCMLDSYVIFVLVLYIWKLLFPTKLLEYQSCDWYLYNFATRMSICRLPAFSVFLIGEGKELAACDRQEWR